MGEHEADFVHVRGNHHPQAAGSRAALDREDVAEGVHAHLIGQRADVFQHDFAHRTFIAGNRHSLGEALQQASLARAEGGKVRQGQGGLLQEILSITATGLVNRSAEVELQPTFACVGHN